MDRRAFVERSLGAVVGIGWAGALASCGGDDGPTDPGGNGGGGDGGGGGGGDGNTVQVDDNFFSPASLTIQEGETVTWEHVGGVYHSITPEGHSEWEDHDFPAGASDFTHTFDTPGTYPYYCRPHRSEGMEGTITVESSSS